jgi:hypothetical protein
MDFAFSNAINTKNEYNGLFEEKTRMKNGSRTGISRV